MKRLMTTAAWLMLTLSVLAPPAFAQQWHWQNPQPSGNSMTGLCFADAATGWAVGSFGTLQKTTDGGASWNTQNPGTTATFESVSCAGPNRVWAAGYNWQTQRGTVARSTDGGATWSRQTAFPGVWFYQVQFTDSLNGWVVGTTAVFHTSNGGQSWQNQYYNENSEFYGFSALDGQTAWAVGFDYLSNASIVVHTTDGANWQMQFTNSMGRLWSVAFANADTGWAVGLDRNFVNTTDGGATWTEQISDYLYPRVVQFLTPRAGFIACDGGIVLRTQNAGASWDTLGYQTESYPEGMLFRDMQHGWVLGSGGAFYYTADGGTQWTRRGEGVQSTLYDVCFVDSSNGWCAGAYNTLLHTTNGGAQWLPQSTGLASGYWPGIYFRDSQHGWLCGAYTSGMILHTDNGGDTWQVQGEDFPDLPNRMAFCDDQNGWAVGETGLIVHTTDGGTHWEVQTSPTDLPLRDVACTSPERAWAIAHEESGDYNGLVLNTTDGGATWAIQATLPYGYIFGLWMQDSQNGWICGASLLVGRANFWQTVNGGANWSSVTATGPAVLTSIAFSGSLGIAASSWGTILRTTDNGISWAADTTVTDNQLLGVAIAGQTHGWAVGAGGTILRCDTPPLSAPGPQAALPDEWELKAYPNPFNPSTTLELSLPHRDHVRVSLYDLNGRLVTILGDRFYEAGSQRIYVDGSRLSSGIYFARVESGDHVRTQRLLLLK